MRRRTCWRVLGALVVVATLSELPARVAGVLPVPFGPQVSSRSPTMPPAARFAAARARASPPRAPGRPVRRGAKARGGGDVNRRRDHLHPATSSSPRPPRRHLTVASSSSSPEVTPDGILDSAPEGLPLDPPEPPTPALPSVAPPLADPVSLTPLDARTGYARANGLRYAETDGVWDLTLGAAVNAPGGSGDATSLADLARSLLPLELRGLIPTSGYLGTATFETPQVAFAYERGWRDSFARAGFPGPDEEFELARAKLLPHAANGVLLDASCGSGLFSRRFAKSGEYGAVIALDFSDAMLRQARRFARDEGLLGGDDDGAEDSGPTTTSPLTFVRADIARLPFPSGTIAGVHAGAAIHCWPDPRSALAEVARVMTPGASFCGTTFLTPRVPFADDQAQRAIDAAMREVQDAVAGRAGGARGFRMWNKLDLKELCVDSGLVDFECDERGGFIFFAAKKPPAYEEPEDEAYRPTEI